MKTFRVLHICDFAAPYRGNFIDSIDSIETYHNNVETFYLFPSQAKETGALEWIENLNSDHERAYIQENSFFKNFILLFRILKKHKINRIVRHFADSKIDLLVKLLFKGQYVIRFFHSGCHCSKNRIKHSLKEFVWRKNKLVGVSDATTCEIRQVHPKFSSFSILNAIHFQRLNVQDSFEKAEGVSLLVMGWDCMIKGVDLAIRASLPLRSKYNITLHIVCGSSKDEIMECANRILGKDVDWIRYLPQTNNIGTYFWANNIFLSPSRQEAFGYANIEAVYCKNSVVLSRVGGQKELKIDGAYWFDSENIDEFTQQLESAILEFDTPEKVAQRENARSQVLQTYSLKQWTDKLVDLFD